MIRQYIETTLHVWLIVCIGGLIPLTYADTFSAHQDVPAYRLSLLYEVPSALPATLVAKLSGKSTWGHVHQPTQSNYQRAVPAHSRTFYTELSDGFILALLITILLLMGPKTLLLQPCSRSSVVVPPLDKPPRW